MNQDQLEATVRATLTARADTVTRGPDWHAPTDLSTGRARTRHVAWIAPLAAAAAVAAIVASVVAIEHESSGRHVPPATQHPSGTPTRAAPTTSAATTPTPTIPLACRTTLPRAWVHAIGSSRLDFHSMAASIDDIAPDGTLVVSRDFGVTPGSARDIVLASPRGPFHTVYQVADPDRQDATAEIYEHWLVVAINSRGRAPAHTIPNFPPPTMEQLLVIDLDNGARHQIASVPTSDANAGTSPTIELSTVLDGRVYWEIRRRYASPTGTIKSYDIRTGTVLTEYAGPVAPYPAISAAGIGSSGPTHPRLYVPAQLPPTVARNVNPALPMFVTTDGTAWAWVKDAHTFGWWTKGLSAPVYVRTPKPVDLDNGPTGFVVSGHYVFTDDQVVDMTAQAIAPLVGHGLPTGKFAQFEPDAAHDGVLYATEYAGTGHYVNGYWEDPQPQVQRIFTSNGLPNLHC